MSLVRPVLTALLLSGATGARAQEVEAVVVDLARALSCEAELETLELIVRNGLARPPEELEAAVAGLVASGQAERSADGATLRLLPPLCDATTDAGAVDPVPWIEARLLGGEGCRRPLAELASEAEGAGLPADAFDAAVLELAAAGVVVPEGGDLLHAICAPGGVATVGPLERVELFGMPGFRGLVALRLGDRGCRLTPEERPEAVAELAAAAAAQMGLAAPVPPEVLAAIRERIEEVLDNPGPAYEIDPATGDLVYLHCTP